MVAEYENFNVKADNLTKRAGTRDFCELRSSGNMQGNPESSVSQIGQNCN